MRCLSKKTKYTKKAFSLVEAMTALIILSLVSSSVFVVVNRCMVSASESAKRMQAFNVARNNMEALLALDSVEQKVEYGASENYPDIQWKTAVETFYEPITKRMWVQAICSADYIDTAGETQTVELTNWLTNLSKQQVVDALEQGSGSVHRPEDESGPGPEDDTLYMDCSKYPEEFMAIFAQLGIECL